MGIDMDICLGVDIGTTSVSCVAVDAEGRCLAVRTQEHAADVIGLPPGFAEQDPARLASVARSLVAQFEAEFGPAEEIGWTGQMHGVVGVDDGLRLMAGKEKIDGFAIRGEKRDDWRWADARIEGDEIVLSSPEVPNPVAARYGWARRPRLTLESAHGLPLRPFSTDHGSTLDYGK